MGVGAHGRNASGGHPRRAEVGENRPVFEGLTALGTSRPIGLFVSLET
jgi:hypothetical protein